MPGQAGRGFWRNQGGTGIPPFDTLRYSWSGKSGEEKDMPGKSLIEETERQKRVQPSQINLTDLKNSL